MANKYVQLRDAQGNNIFPRIDLTNVENLLDMSKINGLSDALGLKLDASVISNYSTTEQMTAAIGEAIAGVNSFEYVVLGADEELPTGENAKSHTIYLKPRTAGVNGKDVYDEYILINGEFELIGNTELDLSNYYTKGEVDSAIDTDVAALKAIVDAYTVNGKAIAASPVLSGADIVLTGYTADEGGIGIDAEDSINEAFKKIDEGFKTLSGDSTESLGAIVGRVTTLEGEMDAAEGRLDVIEPKVTTLESITKGYTTEGEIKAAVDAKADQTAVDDVIGSEGTLTKAVEANTAAVATKAEQSVVSGIDGRLQTAEGEIDTLQGALEGLLSTGAVQDALDLKANATDVDAKIGADGTITKAVEANTTAIANMGNIVSLSYVEINADGTEIEG